jgi:hypothetical protein
MDTRILSMIRLLFLISQLCVVRVSAGQEKPATPGVQTSAAAIRKDFAGAGGEFSSKQLGDHYLMLVNTAVASYMTEEKLRQFDKSPYDGLAVAFLHAYDTSTPPTVASIDQQIARWKGFTSKDIWPWVYVNRMIGMSVAENNSHSDQPYFRRIIGADLDDKNGALSDFLNIWRNSLAGARDSRVPGIVCDLEFYNHYKEYDIGELAHQTGKAPPQAAESLKHLGAKMADLAVETYPHATIWMLFTALTHPGYKKFDGVPYYPSPAYISIGLLDEIAKKRLPLKVITGGEGSIGYCHDSLEQFKSAIQQRQSDLEAELAKYSGILELGGTLALWSDRALKKDWLNQGSCKASDADSIENLEPYIELLLTIYRYNWLYGTSEGNYLPFSASSAPRFDRVIDKAKKAVISKSPKPL